MQIMNEAVALADDGRHDEAARVLRVGWREQPDEAYLGAMLGMALVEVDPVEAKNVFREAASRAGDDAGALLQIGRGFSLLESWDEVEDVVSRIDAGDARSMHTFLRGALLLARCQTEPAVELLEEAYSVEPDIDDGVALAEACARDGQLERCRVVVSEGLRRRPGHEYLEELRSWLVSEGFAP